MNRSTPALPARLATGRADDPCRLRLTLRYVLALAIIGAVLMAQQGLSNLKAGRLEADGALINDSGAQRMLSQRIAMLASDLVNQDHEQLRRERLGALEAALIRMQDNHDRLQRDWQARAAQGEPSFGLLLDDEGVAVQVDSFLSLTRTLLPDGGRTAEERLVATNTALSLAEIARGDFLDQLDEAVQLHELHNRQGMARLRSAGTLSVVFGLLLLIAIGMSIFQPMVNRIVRTIESLRESRDEQFELGRRMSHDLRAPIASSRGLVSIVEEALQEGDLDEVGEAVGRLNGALSHLDGMLAQLAVVTRLHRTAPRSETFALDVLLAEVFPGNNASAETEVIDAIDRPLVTDRALLRDILRALFDNAVAFRQGAMAQVQVRAWTDLRGVRISVEDAGIGIPEPCRARVFEMFQRFHPARGQGAGLGLYRARMSARALGGGLEYEPLPAGSRFTLTLPDKRVPAP